MSVSYSNSIQNITIGANFEFAGSYIGISGSSHVDIYIHTTLTAGQLYTIYADFSNDEINVCKTYTRTITFGGNYDNTKLEIFGRYVKIRLVNDKIPINNFYLYTIIKQNVSYSPNINIVDCALPTGASTEATLSTIDKKIPSLGQKAEGGSMPVVLPILQINALRALYSLGQATAEFSVPIVLTEEQIDIMSLPPLGQATVEFSVPVVLPITQIDALKPLALQPVSGNFLTNEQLRETAISFLNGVEDPLNSTTTVLASLAVFTGSWVNTLLYSQITISTETDRNTAVTVQFSSNGSDLGVENITFQNANGNALFINVEPKMKYYRLKIENTDIFGALSYLRFNSILRCRVSL